MAEENKENLTSNDLQVSEPLSQSPGESGYSQSDDNEIGSKELVEEALHPYLSGVSQAAYDRLTKRNQEYMLQLDRILGDNLHVDMKQPIYQEMVETLISGQQSGQTARQLYGTPTECAKMLVEDYHSYQEKEEESPEWQVALDGGLILGSTFTLITGISIMSNQASDGELEANYMGIITLIINYLLACLVMWVTAKNLPDLDAPKGKQGYWKYFFTSIAAMVLWFIGVSLAQVIIPSTINPSLPAWGYLIIGGLTLGLRFYLKRRWNIQGGIF